ncbi:MAG: hypothetical protein EBS19_11965 [Spirochaetia bacterium]|nr:hypothetical protein [Spirochaetia bacterium]
MEEVDIASRLQRFMKDQLKNLTSIITSGGVDNMEDYKYILGQIRTYEYLLQEISNLLNKKELNADAGNIIKLD